MKSGKCLFYRTLFVFPERALTPIAPIRYVTCMGFLSSFHRRDQLALEGKNLSITSARSMSHSPWIAAGTWDRRPFSSLENLAAQLDETLRAAEPPAHLELIKAHPDLAGRLARQGQLTEESTQEQQSAGLDRLTSEEAAEFDRLNGAYLQRSNFRLSSARG